METNAKETNLKLYSLGIVVETKPPGTDYVLVSPIEDLNIQEPGKIFEHKKEYKGEKKELESKQFKTEHESKNYLRAKWIPFGHSNRISAPDVVANETILLFKYENIDEYYWTTIFREPELRRLEDVIYAYSNMRKGITEFDSGTSYWVRVSTKDKFVHVHTAANDGEVCEYDAKFDTKAGTFELKDSLGNFIKLDSPGGLWHIKANKEIILEAPKITHIAPERVMHKTPLVINTNDMHTYKSHIAHPNLNAVLGGPSCGHSGD